MAALSLPLAAIPDPRMLQFVHADVAGYRCVRVAVLETGPSGFDVVNYEYVMTPAPSGWKLAGRVVGVIVE